MHKHLMIICVLKSGGVYNTDHVLYLASQLRKYAPVHQFICLSDVGFHVPKGVVLSLKHNWSGWWSKIELFRFPGRIVYLDLDTMFFSRIDKLVNTVMETEEKKFWMLRSFLPPERGISGIMAWNGDFTDIYDNFQYEKHSERFRGDQEYIRSYLNSRAFPISFIQDSLDGVYSWKRNCKGSVPKDCSILVFHGKPRPWKVDSLWQPMVEEHTR